MPRKIRSPTGVEAFAHVNVFGKADYFVTDGAAHPLGYVRRISQGSRTAWALGTTRDGPFTGRYVDLPHAVDGLIARGRT